MELKIKRLDGRFTGNRDFTYCIDFNFSQRQNFREIREWCWETFGPSCEFNFLHHDEEKTWAWDASSYRIRIYFKSDAELNWYKLRWL